MDHYNLIIAARALHVVGGVFWAGFVLTIVLLMAIAAGRSPQDRRSLRSLVTSLAPRVMPLAGGITLLSGIYLFAVLHDSDRSFGAYVLGFGALAAIAASVAGSAGAGRAARQLALIDAAPEQPGAAAEAARLEHRLTAAARLSAVLIVISAAAMGVARYL